MQGASGTFGINGTDFILPPSTAAWGTRDTLGIDGNGHPIYPALRTFEMMWELASPSDVKQLIDTYNSVSNTGTVVFDLPKWGDANYIFYSYSGCVLREAETGVYFNEYITDVRVIIDKVRTT